jgi:hypothetical protein
MTGAMTGATGAMTGKTTGATGAMTGKTAIAGLGCSGDRDLGDQAGRACQWRQPRQSSSSRPEDASCRPARTYDRRRR